MKKLLYILILCLTFGTACKNNKKNISLLPTDVLSVSQAQKVVGEDYALILKNDSLEEDDEKVTATYLADPLGSGDNVFVSVYKTSKDAQEKFEASRNKRSDFISIEDLGDDAYVTYPTLHLYCNGFYVSITAGSEGKEEQLELLKKLGEIAVKNITAFSAS